MSRALEIAQARAQQAAKNRASMPLCTEMIDAARETFGPECRIVFASESGKTVGKPTAPGTVAETACVPVAKERVRARKQPEAAPRQGVLA